MDSGLSTTINVRFMSGLEIIIVPAFVRAKDGSGYEAEAPVLRNYYWGKASKETCKQRTTMSSMWIIKYDCLYETNRKSNDMGVS